MEEQGAHTGEKQGGLDGKGQPVALDQDGDQHGSAEHGEHMLKAEDQHFGQAQLTGVADRLVVIHLHFSLHVWHTKKDNHIVIVSGR